MSSDLDDKAAAVTSAEEYAERALHILHALEDKELTALVCYYNVLWQFYRVRTQQRRLSEVEDFAARKLCCVLRHPWQGKDGEETADALEDLTAFTELISNKRTTMEEFEVEHANCILAIDGCRVLPLPDNLKAGAEDLLDI